MQTVPSWKGFGRRESAHVYCYLGKKIPRSHSPGRAAHAPPSVDPPSPHAPPPPTPSTGILPPIPAPLPTSGDLPPFLRRRRRRAPPSVPRAAAAGTAPSNPCAAAAARHVPPFPVPPPHLAAGAAFYSSKSRTPAPPPTHRPCCRGRPPLSFAALFSFCGVVFISVVQVKELQNPDDVFDTILGLIVRLAEHGLIHCDFNEFNMMIDDDEKITGY